jgi:ATP phosphoribosyltransferase regulatory subunit
MSKELVHTPEGVRDVYGRESYERSTVKHKIRRSCTATDMRIS